MLLLTSRHPYISISRTLRPCQRYSRPGQTPHLLNQCTRRHITPLRVPVNHSATTTPSHHISSPIRHRSPTIRRTLRRHWYILTANPWCNNTHHPCRSHRRRHHLPHHRVHHLYPHRRTWRPSRRPHRQMAYLPVSPCPRRPFRPISPSRRSCPASSPCTSFTYISSTSVEGYTSLLRAHAQIYCIIPVIHRPSFTQDLANREEERRPVLFALIMAMIAVTLIHVGLTISDEASDEQIPRTFFPTLQGDSVRKLSDHCLKACYAISRREMDNLSVDLICIK